VEFGVFALVNFSIEGMELDDSGLGVGANAITNKGYFPIFKQYFTVGLVSVVLGNTVPTNYNQNPESFLYVSMLIIILLALWGSYLGESLPSSPYLILSPYRNLRS
jgi:hypothetical protein